MLDLLRYLRVTFNMGTIFCSSHFLPSCLVMEEPGGVSMMIPIDWHSCKISMQDAPVNWVNLGKSKKPMLSQWARGNDHTACQVCIAFQLYMPAACFMKNPFSGASLSTTPNPALLRATTSAASVQ